MNVYETLHLPYLISTNKESKDIYFCETQLKDQIHMKSLLKFQDILYPNPSNETMELDIQRIGNNL